MVPIAHQFSDPFFDKMALANSGVTAISKGPQVCGSTSSSRAALCLGLPLAIAPRCRVMGLARFASG